MKLVFYTEFEPGSEARGYILILEVVAEVRGISHQKRLGGQKVDARFPHWKDYCQRFALVGAVAAVAGVHGSIGGFHRVNSLFLLLFGQDCA